MLAWLDGELPDDLAPDPSGGRPGFFETMRVSQGRIPWLADHRARIESTRRATGFPAGSLLEEGFEACKRLAVALEHPTGRLRLTVWMDDEGAPHVAVRLVPSFPDRGPWHVGVAGGHPGWPAGAHKRTAREPWDLALDEARSRGLDEVLMIDAAGHVVEGTRTSLFVVTADGAIRTPPLELGALPGVARARCLLLFAAHGFEVEVRPIPWSELGEARELICTNAWLGAVPVASLEGRHDFARELGEWLAARLFS